MWGNSSLFIVIFGQAKMPASAIFVPVIKMSLNSQPRIFFFFRISHRIPSFCQADALQIPFNSAKFIDMWELQPDREENIAFNGMKINCNSAYSLLKNNYLLALGITCLKAILLVCFWLPSYKQSDCLLFHLKCTPFYPLVSKSPKHV